MSDPRDRILRRTECAAAGLVTFAVLALHAVRAASAGPLWRDEAAAVTLARMPLPELVANFQHEAFPLLFPAAVRGFTALAGTGADSLRVFGLLAGILGVAVLWLNARLVNRGVPLVALVLFGFSPVFFIWGDSIRGYGLGAVCIMLTFGLLARSVVRPEPWVFWTALAAAVASVQCLLANSVLLFALGVSAAAAHLFLGRKRHALLVLGIGGVAALTLLPYAGSYLSGKEWDVVFRSEVSLPWLWGRFSETLDGPVAGMRWVWLALFAVGVAGAAGLVARKNGDPAGSRGLAGFVLLACVLAPVCHGVFLLLLGYPTQAWYYLALIAVLVAGLDAATGAGAENFRWARWLRLAAAVLLVAVLAGPAFTKARERMSNMDLVARTLEERAGAGDLIIVNPWYLGLSFQWHFHGKTPWTTLPPMRDLRIHRYDLLKEQMTLADPLAPVREQAGKTLRAGNRLWIVGGLGQPQPGQPPPTLPPAPSAEAGWSEAAYTTVWSVQMGHFVQTHARRGQKIPIESPRPVNRFEDVSLSVIEGWRGTP